MNTKIKNRNFLIQSDFKKRKSKNLMPFWTSWWIKINWISSLTIQIGINKEDSGPSLILFTDKEMYHCQNYNMAEISPKKNKKNKWYSETLRDNTLIKKNNHSRWIKLLGWQGKITILEVPLRLDRIIWWIGLNWHQLRMTPMKGSSKWLVSMRTGIENLID